MTGDWFVGRRDELAQLQGLVAAVAGGSGRVVLVEGEQGIGKSSLLRAGLAGAAAGCRVLWGAADELGQRFPLRLMTECLGEAGRLAADGVAGGRGAGAGTAAAGRASGIGDAVLAFGGDPVLAGVERLLAGVDRLCALSPVVLVAEDLQWADEASVLVWYQLSRAAGQLPLLLAGSWRPGTGRQDLVQLRRGVVARGGTALALEALPAPDVADLVAGLVGARPGRRLSGVLGRAGGNPLYARELTDGLVREGRVQVEAGVGELAGRSVVVQVPVSLAAAIAGRLTGLAQDVVGVLRWAAVLGQEFSVTDLEVVTGRTAGELMGVVEAAAAAGVVTDAGRRLGFRHALIRQVLYEGMPVALRAALHLQAARALADAGAAAERVAAQLVPGPGEADALAAGMSEAWLAEWLAGSAPALIYRAPQVAAELLRDVLARLADDDPRRGDLQASLVTVAFLLARDEEVERVGELLLTRSADPDRAGEMAWLVAYAQLRTGRPAQGEATIGEALRRSGLSLARAARLRALHAIILSTADDADQAEETARSALACAEQAGSALAAGYALHAMSNVSFIRRDHVALLDYTQRALAAVGDDPRATDLRLLALSARTATLGDLDRQPEALAAARQALVLAEQTGTPRLEMIRGFLAHRYFELGQWDDALAELEPADGPQSPVHVLVMTHGLGALIAGHREDRAAADEHLHAAADLVLDPAVRSNSHFMLLAQALIAEQDGRPAAAVALLAPCLQPGIDETMPSRFLLLPTLARLALAGDDAAMVEATAEAAAYEAAREPLPVKAAAADHCRGLAAGDPAPLLAAAGYYGRAGRPREQAHSLEDAAVLAARRGALPAAREALAAAVALYRGLGAQWDVRRAGMRLRPYGVRQARGGYRARPATGWEALTPTEVKVAYLVAGGRSNPDVAAELFLSRNTVQTHVSHILAKLGARSRAEIVREALAQPRERLPVS